MQFSYDNFTAFSFTASVRFRFYAPRVAGFVLWSTVTFALGLLWIAINCYQSGKLFRTQFNDGYNGLDGSFCRMACVIACELPQVATAVADDSFDLVSILDSYGVLSSAAAKFPQFTFVSDLHEVLSEDVVTDDVAPLTLLQELKCAAQSLGIRNWKSYRKVGSIETVIVNRLSEA